MMQVLQTLTSPQLFKTNRLIQNIWYAIIKTYILRDRKKMVSSYQEMKDQRLLSILIVSSRD